MDLIKYPCPDCKQIIHELFSLKNTCSICDEYFCAVCLYEIAIENNGLTLKNICYKCFTKNHTVGGEDNYWVGLSAHSVRKIIGRNSKKSNRIVEHELF